MRVIAGEFAGRRLVAPEGLRTTRPTTDRVREAVFNALTSRGILEGALVVDLFAGSGAVGIEALSRGAATCTFVERDPRALRALRSNLDTLDVAARSVVIGADVMATLERLGSVDVVLADPPYEFDDWDRILAGVDASLLIAESDRDLVATEPWEVARHRRYGRTRVTWFERVP
jgi:16S rRNA (guanine966-N2)-methyltransferase